MTAVRLQVPLRRAGRITGPVSGLVFPVDKQGYVDVDPSDVTRLLGEGYGRGFEGNDNVFGAAPSYVTASEFGDVRQHKTVLAINTVLPAIAGGANLAVGKKIYDFPAGEIIIDAAYMSLAITQTEGNIDADTPDVGLGTVIGSGAVAVLGGTATFENIITGQTAADCNGTPTVKTAIPTAGAPLVIAAAGAHSVFANAADGWAASGDAAALLVGTVILHWRKMDL